MTDALQVLANTETSIPEAGTFTDFDPLDLEALAASEGAVVFAGNGDALQRGLYQRDAAGLQLRVDKHDTSNSSASFVG